MFATLLRVLFGFLAACFVVGLVQVGFVMPPAEIWAMPENAIYDRLGDASVLTMVAATQSAVFAAPFALVAAAIAEWQGIRSFLFYVLVGFAICAAGLVALHLAAADNEPTIANAYAISAFGISGFFGGAVYWLLAGRLSGEGLDDYDYAPPIVASPPAYANRPVAAVPQPRSTPTPATPAAPPTVPTTAPRKA